MNSETFAARMPWSAVRAYGATSKHDAVASASARARRPVSSMSWRPCSALAQAVARAADQPEPGVRDLRVDLVPQLEQVVDVVERVVGVAVAARQQVGGHPAEHDLARLACGAAACSRSSGVAAERLTPCGITTQGLSTPSDS